MQTTGLRLRTNKITQQINTFRDDRERKFYKCTLLEGLKESQGSLWFLRELIL